MSLSGARGLTRIAHNPTCELQAAMVLERVREPDVYQAIAGEAYPGEYGERISARRRGTQFENNLFKDDGALLREILAPVLHAEAAQMTIRNLMVAVRGDNVDAMTERHQCTRALLADLAAGKTVPDLLIQPQLRLATNADAPDAIFIAPDVLALDRERRVYLPVEVKSFIVRDGIVDRTDRDGARRQAAVQLLALRGELTPLGIADRLLDRALFIFATPFGLKPNPPFAEELSAELYEMRRALATLGEVRARLRAMGSTSSLDSMTLARLAPQLTVNYQESCVAGCLLARLCRQRVVGQAVLLGDAVAEVLGVDLSLPRAIDLLRGAAPATRREQQLAPALRDAAAIFGWTPGVNGRIV